MFFNPVNLHAIEASLFAAFLSALGLFTVAAFGDMGRRYSPYISAFAIGVLATSTIFQLLPEGHAISPRIWQWVSFGFGGFLLLDFIVRILTSGKSLNTDLAFASTSVIALGAHSFLDGILYAMAFQGSVFTGWMTAIGLLAHELPEGIIIYYLLRGSRLSVPAAMVIAFFAACVTTVLGTYSALNFFSLASASLPMMMGLTAGAFIYVILVHLAPHAATAPDRRGYLAASLGVVLTTIAIIIGHI